MSTDTVTPEQRSRNMSKIKGKNTKPEMTVRSLCHELGLRYRLHQKHLPGTPDMVFPKRRLCLFVHGCFWHRHPGCPYATNPKSREDFWRAKFEQNVKRDIRNRNELLQQGWRVFELWECGIRRPEAEIQWLLKAVPDCEQRYISWPAVHTEPSN